MNPLSRSAWSPVWAVLFVGLVLASTLGALGMAAADSITALWWPATGFGIAALAFSPLRWWPALGVAVGASTLTAALVHDSAPIHLTIAFSVISVLESLAGATVLRVRRRPEEVRLTTPQDAARMALAALASSAVSALGSALVVLVEGSESAEWMLSSLFPSHLSASLVILLLVLSFRSPRRRGNRVELVAQASLLATTLGVLHVSGGHPTLSPVPLILLIWAAYRFGLRVLAWQVLATAVLSLATVTDPERFATLTTGPVDAQMVATLTHLFLICVVLICLPVAIGVHTNDLFQRQLRTSRHLSDITLSTTACIILVTDVRGTVLRANPAVTTLLGHDLDTVVGRPVWDTIALPEDRTALRGLFASGDGTGLPRQLEGRALDVNGLEHRVAWTSGIVRDNGAATHVVLTGLDVTAERNAAGLMEHLLAAAIDTAIIGTDPQGTVTLFNTGAQTMLGRSAGEAIGTPFTDLLDPDSFEQWATRRDTTPSFETLVAHLAGGPPQDWAWRTSPAPDAPTLRVSMSLTRVTDHRNALVGYLCVGTDMTDVHATAELLLNALEKERQVVGHLRDLDIAKDQFVSTVSHELRTPVATIVGYGEMMTDGDLGDLSGPQRKAVQAIVRNGERLVDLVDNLLALGGLSADGPNWDRDPVDLRDVVREVKVDTAPLLENRLLSVAFQVPDTPVPVIGEQATLVLALNNLVGNAVKFTEDGGQIRCVLDVVDSQARILVDDTGLGIPADEVAHVFERFWRSSTSQQHEIQGTGLGLPTVQTIVRAHGGSITLESVEGRGTTATLLLPLHVEGRARAAAVDSGDVRRG